MESIVWLRRNNVQYTLIELPAATLWDDVGISYIIIIPLHSIYQFGFRYIHVCLHFFVILCFGGERMKNVHLYSDRVVGVELK